MSFDIVDRPKITIAGLTVQSLLKDTKEKKIIPNLQNEFNLRIDEVKGAFGLPVTYGVFIDPINYKPETDPFTWIAGVEIESVNDIPSDMIVHEIPAGKYAVYDYEGNIDEAGSAYDTLYKLIKNSEYNICDTYGFEEYAIVHSVLERKNAQFKLHFPITEKHDK